MKPQPKQLFYTAIFYCCVDLFAPSSPQWATNTGAPQQLGGADPQPILMGLLSLVKQMNQILGQMCNYPSLCGWRSLVLYERLEPINK